MATRSMIAYEVSTDPLYPQVLAIYCHNDGYPRHNGRILLDHYNTPEKVAKLMELGHLSLLGNEIGEKQDFDQPTDRNWCLAYGRDRGETFQHAAKFLSLAEAISNFDECDWFYYYNGEYWKYRTYKGDWGILTDSACENW